jgi:hypothetical protein
MLCKSLTELLVIAIAIVAEEQAYRLSSTLDAVYKLYT